MSIKIGQRVKIEEWVVADQSDNTILTTKGTVVSNVMMHKLQGYKNEYELNGYVKVKLDCGNVLSFNCHELTLI